MLLVQIIRKPVGDVICSCITDKCMWLGQGKQLDACGYKRLHRFTKEAKL